jgi:predicted  nucleic acid-binding Zn-ribbon protein
MSPFGIENLPGEALRALRTLPFIADRLEAVAEHTGVLPQVGEDVQDIRAKMATIEDAMPTLVEVQQHLAELPATMQSLDNVLGSLTELLGRLVTSVEQLDGNVGSLQESMEPVGRLADKLPGRSRRS